MNTILVTWILVVVGIAVAAAVEGLLFYRRTQRLKQHAKREHHHAPILSMGQESDEFFVPGDAMPDERPDD